MSDAGRTNIMDDPPAPFSTSASISSTRKRDLLRQQKHMLSRGMTTGTASSNNQGGMETSSVASSSSHHHHHQNHHHQQHNTSFGEFLESPAKKFRNGQDTMVGEVEALGQPQFVIDTTLVTMNNNNNNNLKDSSSSLVGTGNEETGSVISDCATETSSVAHLRGWLNEFGQQNKKHFETNTSIGIAPPDAVKVTRTRVARSKPELPPTPLPPASHAAFQRRADSIPRARATPVRIRSRHSDVQATNDGYKSVAKLSAWLADDPTKNKDAKKSIRRGANVIAKSRAFDKGLAGVIVEQHNIRSGSVQDASRRYDHHSDSGVDDHDDQRSFCADDNSSCVSVSDKKAWLAGAFKKEESAVERARTELVTEQEKRDDATARAKQKWRERSSSATKPRAPSSSSRAKEMWRERSASATKPRTPSISSRARQMERSTSATKPRAPSTSSRAKQMERAVSATKPRAPSTSSRAKQMGQTGLPPMSPSKKKNTRSHGVVEKENETADHVQNAPRRPSEEKGAQQGADKELDFSEARKLLVQRSKQNGHSVEVITKVAMKKAKFERIEKDNRRRSSSHGLLKPHWEEAGHGSNYVKSFKSNPSSRKSLEELP